MQKTKFLSDDRYIIAKGNERVCYQDPNDNTKVIKVTHTKKRGQNELEEAYYKYLIAKKRDFSHIAKYIRSININGEKALVFEKILNYDNSPSITFAKALKEKKINISQAKSLLNELKNYLFSNKILFIDVDLENIMLREYKKNHFKLVIIDGLGGRRKNWKFFLYLHLPFYTYYKIKKQYKKLLDKFYTFIKEENLIEPSDKL